MAIDPPGCLTNVPHKRNNRNSGGWFTWKDVRGSCSFCDSSGLFRRGARFKPKPAWHAFVDVAPGRLR